MSERTSIGSSRATQPKPDGPIANARDELEDDRREP